MDLFDDLILEEALDSGSGAVQEETYTIPGADEDTISQESALYEVMQEAKCGGKKRKGKTKKAKLDDEEDEDDDIEQESVLYDVMQESKKSKKRKAKKSKLDDEEDEDEDIEQESMLYRI